jgi:photosystem II stability/assembly factor-like uncharacterized protein
MKLLCRSISWLSIMTLCSVVSAQEQATSKEKVLEALSWRSIGPAVMGGRTVDIAGIPGDPSTVYMATASGGLFKTTNRGTTWRSIFESGNTLSLGAVAVAPSDRNVVYIGTGENNPRNSASIGDGIYKSVDGGETWTHLGLEQTEKIARIRIHPRDPDVVYVAALGHEWGENEERGVFRTEDGGESWQKVLYVDENTGASDLAMDPDNPGILYAGMYDFRRLPWSFRSGGPGSGLYKTTDGGESWTKLTEPGLDNGLPIGVLGRIGVAVAPSEARVVYAAIEAERGVMWRSADRGKTWEMVNEDKTIHSRPFYFSDIRVDPENENRVYLLEGRLRVSEDGGRTWDTTANTVHGDHQALWIDPEDPNRLINGNDGGWGFSYDRGETWEFINSVPLGQFYQITADRQDPYFVCGGLQDNHVWCGPSNNFTPLGILNGDWYRIHPGGDGYYVQVHPTDPNIIYTNTHYGNIQRVDRRTGDSRPIHPYPVNIRGAASFEHPYRFNWNSPIHMSPHDPDVVYFGSNVLFKTVDGGQSWDIVSPDLTTNDSEKLQVSGGPITPDNTSAEYHCTIITIAESPLTQGLIWIGTDDGKVQLTRNGGESWDDVTENIPGQSPTGWVSRVEASPSDPAKAYITIDRHRSNDPAPYVFVTSDYGQSWSNISGNLPPLNYAHVVREDPRNPNLIYVGTELGIYASWSGGEDWTSLRLNLPPVAVRDMLVHPDANDIVIGTHGRSAWILDDVTPLQRLNDAMAQERYLFEPRRATRWVRWNRNHAGYPGQRWLGDQTFYGENPPYGAILDFYLKELPLVDVDTDGDEQEEEDEPKLTLVIRDADNREVRSLEGVVRVGLNRFVWDLRHSPLAEPEGVAKVGFNADDAPLVPPGTYTVALPSGDGELTEELRVRLDPRVSITDSEAMAQYEAVSRLTAMEERAMTALQTVERVRSELERLIERLRGENGGAGAQAGAGLADDAEAINERLDEIQSKLVRKTPELAYRSSAQLLEKIRQLRSGGGNYPGIQGATAAPTDAQAEWIERLDEELASVESTLNGVVSGELAALNQRLAESGVPHISAR